MTIDRLYQRKTGRRQTGETRDRTENSKKPAAKQTSPARYHSPKAPKYRVSEARETIKLLLDHGALWRPDEVKQIATVRRLLCQCEPDVTLELIELFVKHSACAPEIIHNLIRTPEMKEHLAPVVRYVVRLGFDIRTPKQKLEDEKQEEKHRQWAVVQLASRYDREKVYGEIWAEPRY